MILKEIHIDGFGIFNDITEKFTNGINIISGPNEAGKSTLLKFIRFALFGYRPREARMQALKGGRLGGTVKVLMRSGEEIILERKENLFTFYQNDLPVRDSNRWPAMLNNAGDSLFRNIYAFSLDDLNDTKGFEESGIEDRIFSISTGLGNISVGDISAAIQSEAESIYKPAGKIQKIPRSLNLIAEKKKALDSVMNNLAGYEELQRNLAELTKAISLLERDIKEMTEGKNKLSNYLKCYGSYIKISQYDKELEDLPQLAEYPAAGPERLTELEKEEKLYLDRIKDLTEGADEGKGILELEAEYDSLSFREELVSKKDDAEFLAGKFELFSQSLTEKQELDNKIDNLNREVNKLLKSLGADWTEQNVADLSEILVYQDRIRQFKSGFDALDRKRLEKETLLKSAEAGRKVINTGNLINMVSALLLLASIPFFIYNLPAAGIVCIIAAIAMFAGKKFILVHDPYIEISEELGKIAHEENNLKHEYKIYLVEELHLNGELSTEAAAGAISLVNELKKTILERDQAAVAVKTKERFIDTYEKCVRKFDGTVKFESLETVRRVRQILQEYADDLRISEDRTRLFNDIKAKKMSLARAEKSLAAATESINSLLVSIAAKDREDFRLKYERNSRVAKLMEDRQSEMMTMETIAGKGLAGEVILYLKNCDKEEMENKLEQISAGLLVKNDDLQENYKNIGSLKKEIEQIEGQSAVAEQMTAIETEIKKLETEYHNWISYKLAYRILSDVRGRFEKEKQPEVIRNSSGLFSKLTGGNFARIGVSLDKKEITVFDQRDGGRSLDQLSRGTREQLLLSMRLGFIEEYEKTCEPLPLIVDEIFVNFDHARTVEAAKIFSEFALDRQVLIFSCHPSTIGYFKRSEINVIGL